MRLPKYRKHSSRDRAFVEWNGRRHYFPGAFDSPQSRAAYAEFLRRHLAAEPDLVRAGDTPLVADLAAAFLASEGERLSSFELNHHQCAIRKMLGAYPQAPVDEFGPMALQCVRDLMISTGWSRAHINSQVNRLRRVFRWGVARELVHPNTLAALAAVETLKRGRSAAPEPKKITPPNLRDVAAVLRVVPLTLETMIRVQWLTGMRSHHLCALRMAEIDSRSDVWVYRPVRHDKGRSDRELTIAIGPRTQRLLAPFLTTDRKRYFFSPRRAMKEMGRKPHKRCSSRYTPETYRRAIDYALVRAGCGRFHPHQLRHAAATRARKVAGIEAAQVYLGHETADVTQVYAERDLNKAIELARRIG